MNGPQQIHLHFWGILPGTTRSIQERIDFMPWRLATLQKGGCQHAARSVHSPPHTSAYAVQVTQDHWDSATCSTLVALT